MRIRWKIIYLLALGSIVIGQVLGFADVRALKYQATNQHFKKWANWRWRLQVKDPAQGVQLYQRVEWHPLPQLEVYALAEKDPGEKNGQIFGRFICIGSR